MTASTLRSRFLPRAGLTAFAFFAFIGTAFADDKPLPDVLEVFPFVERSYRADMKRKLCVGFDKRSLFDAERADAASGKDMSAKVLMLVATRALRWALPPLAPARP